jgi:signal transduction histidine kinase
LTETSIEESEILELIHQLPLFAELSTEDIQQLCRASNRKTIKPGNILIKEGAEGDSLYVILTGEVEISKCVGDQEIVLATRQGGAFIGEMSLLEKGPRTATARANSESEVLEIGADAVSRLLATSPSAATTLLRTIAGRLRSTEASLIQNEKLASLGTLAAGLAHELNNPAAAIQRSSDYLSEAFGNWRRRTTDLQAMTFSDEERKRLNELETSIIQCGLSRGDDADSSMDETLLIDELESLDIEEPWEIAPALVAYKWTAERVAELSTTFRGADLNAVLQWFGAGLASQQLVEEIQQSSRTISEIVRAVKSYAYLDQAPVNNVDLRTSLEDTLVILRHKLKHGVQIERDFESELPTIEAYAGELNQVWTNIIDNAVQAMDGKGTLELHARRLGDDVEVRIADSGPGIPPDVVSRIFDPFFTTKPQGVGTGLGLHIARNITVNRHNGRLDVESNPGRTEFRITLPIQLKRR